jgi:hypothetical protein
LIHFRAATRLAHTLRVREQPKSMYWDLAEAAWVVAEEDEAPAQPDYVEDEPELVDAPAD